MPMYRFVTKNGEMHVLEVEFPDDQCAKREAKQAFVEAFEDASLDNGLEITMRAKEKGARFTQPRYDSLVERAFQTKPIPIDRRVPIAILCPHPKKSSVEIRVAYVSDLERQLLHHLCSVK